MRERPHFFARYDSKKPVYLEKKYGCRSETSRWTTFGQTSLAPHRKIYDVNCYNLFGTHFAIKIRRSLTP